MNSKKSNITEYAYKVIRIAMVIGVIAVLFVILKDNILACMEIYPREYRDAANLSTARAFIDGVNPYVLSNDRALPINVYGFVNPLLAAVLSSLTGMRLLNSFYVLYFIASMIFSGLVAYEVYSIAKDRKALSDDKLNRFIFISLTFIIAYTLTYRAGHISTVPDILGMTVGMAILMIARRTNKWWHVLIVSFLVVLEFYIKAYFLFYAAPVFFYYLYKNRKHMLMYMGFCILIGLLSIIIIGKIFPLYFIETIYFQIAEQFLGAYEANDPDKAVGFATAYMLEQFGVLIKKYSIVIIATIAGLLYRIYQLIVSKFKNSNYDLAVYDITFIISIPVLCILGKNDGAYMSYHFQLMMAAAVVIAFVCIIDIFSNEKTTRVVQIVLLCALVFVTYKSYRSFGRVKLIDDAGKQQWVKVEEECLNAYDSGKTVFGGTLVNSVLIDRRSYYTNYNGHNYLELVDEVTAGLIKENELCCTVFKGLDELYDYAVIQNSTIENNISYGKYDIIICDESRVRYMIEESECYDDFDKDDVTLFSGAFDTNIEKYNKRTE